MSLTPDAGAQESPRPGEEPRLALGFSIELMAVGELVAARPSDLAHSAYARLVASWARIEQEAGVYDWSEIGPAVASLRETGFRVVLCLTGSNPLHLPPGKAPSPLEGRSLDAWVAFTRSAARTFAGEVAAFEIWDAPDRASGGTEAFDPGVYAFLLKNTAVAVRAEARDAKIALGNVSPSSIRWLGELLERDAAPYMDVLPVRLEAGAEGPPPAEALASVFAILLEHPPAPTLWAYVGGTAAAPALETLRTGVEALAGTAAAAVVSFPGAVEERAGFLSLTLGVHRALGPGFAPAPKGDLALADLDGTPLAGGRLLGRFYRDADAQTVVVYDAPSAGTEWRQVWLSLDVSDVSNARVVDPATGQEVPTIPSSPPEVKGRRAVRVLAVDHPMLLVFTRKAASVPSLEKSPEKLDVRTTRGLTAEEIIARHQEVQRRQDDRLERWSARGRVDFHFRLAQAGSSVDVATESNYFWERGGSVEWEQTDYYVNGNRVGWKRIPELPLIQPEKVVTVPLDLTLDKTYVYRLTGEDTVEGRPAYVLAFEPADSEAPLSLYRGHVWIDRETFVRLKASVVQTSLEPPVTSNEEVDLYRPVSGPDGESYWMLSRIEGQQIWQAGGRSFVVQRELAFVSFEINPPRPSFDEARKQAYASENQMLRDTEKGFRYLERREDGSRVVKESVDTNQLFAAAGVYKDSSLDHAVLLGGVNYFDYDLFHRDLQLNVLFAGLLAFVNLSDPDLFGSRWTAAVEGVGIAVKGDDKFFQGGQELTIQRVRTRSQNLSARVGRPLGQFFKVTAVGSLSYREYFTSEGETAPAFDLPRDHAVTRAGLELDFNRRGWSVSASGTLSRRSRWEPWGLAGGEGQPPLFDPDRKSYRQWQLSAFKEWFLPRFQKVRVEAGFLDGSRLDRFSRYQFGLFGSDRLNGFAGTGVRFDQGVLARAGYAFNLFGAIRLDASVDTARVKDESGTSGWQRHTGMGFSGNVIGPWKTVIQGSYGRAIASDVSELEGKQEFLLLVFKLF